MTIQLDVPQTPGDGATVSTFQLVPLASIPAATNALPVQLGDTNTLCLENRAAAGIMVQIFPTGSGNGAPYIEFLDPGRKRTYSFGVPLNRMILSNVSVTPLPAPILGVLFPAQSQLQNLTSGYVMVSTTSAELKAENAENVQSQTVVPGSAAAASTLAAGGSGFGTSGTIATITKPLTLYALALSAEFSVVQAAASQPAAGTLLFFYQGVTSGKLVYFGVLGLTAPAYTVAATQRGVAFANMVYPYPIAIGSMFPGDTQLLAGFTCDFAAGVVVNPTMIAITG